MLHRAMPTRLVGYVASAVILASLHYSTTRGVSSSPQLSEADPALHHFRPSRNAIIMIGPGVKLPDLLRMLASMARSAPSAVVALAVDPGEQANSIAAHIVRPGTISTPVSASSAPARIPMWLRLYAFSALDATMPQHTPRRFPAVRRYHHYATMLADLSAGRDEEGGNATAGGGVSWSARGSLVVFSTLDAAHLYEPDGVLVGDARDLVLQRDPFSLMWARYFGLPEFDALVARAAPPTLIAAQEGAAVPIEKEPYTWSWVQHCAGEVGEAQTRHTPVLCSGSTMGNTEGMRAYLAAMNAGADTCADVDWHRGMDQGIHNLLLRRHSEGEWAALESHPLRNETTLGQSKSGDFVGPARALQSAVRLFVTPAEGDLMCTIGQLVLGGVVTRDAEGFVVGAPYSFLGSRPHVDVASSGPSGASAVEAGGGGKGGGDASTGVRGGGAGRAGRRCAVVHQFDRSPELLRFYDGVYGTRG